MITVVCCVCGKKLGTKTGGDGQSDGFCKFHLEEWVRECEQEMIAMREMKEDLSVKFS